MEDKKVIVIEKWVSYIDECIPKTFYPELSSKSRLKMLVEHWQRAIKANQELEKLMGKDMGTFTLDEVLKILENLGHSTSCDTCMEIAFTGSSSTHSHTCSNWTKN